MARNDLFKRYLDAGVALTALTQSRAEALVKDLVKAGELQADQAREAVTDLLERSRANSEKLLETVREEVRTQITGLGLARREDLDRLEARISGLFGGSGAASRGSGQAAPGTTGSSKAEPVAGRPPTTKPAPAKKTQAKRSTPKQAAAKKTAAKKTAAKKAAGTKSTAPRTATTAKKATSARKASKTAKAANASKTANASSKAAKVASPATPTPSTPARSDSAS